VVSAHLRLHRLAYLWRADRVKVWLWSQLIFGSIGWLQGVCPYRESAQTYLGARSVRSGDVMVDGVAPGLCGRSFF